MNSNPRKRSKKTLASIAGLALLAFPLAACGEDEGGSGSGGVAQPAAAIPDMSVAAGGGGTTSVMLDAGTLEALTGLGVTPGPFGSAKITDGSIIFPITGGNVAVYDKNAVKRYVQGQVQHEGSGLSLAAGGKTVVVGNFNVDPTASLIYGDVALDKMVVATSIPLLRLDGRTLMTPTVADGVATLEGSGVFLTQGAADLLNDTFGVDALSGDTKIGIAKVEAKVPSA